MYKSFMHNSGSLFSADSLLIDFFVSGVYTHDDSPSDQSFLSLKSLIISPSS